MDADGLTFLADTRLATAFRRLQRKLERLATRLDDIREDVDDAARAVEVLVSALPSAAAALPRKGVRSPVAPEEQSVLRAEADAGVPSLDVVPHADGSLDVSVNGRRSFRIPPLPATLLQVLVAPGPVAADGLLAWRSRAELAAALGKQTGEPVSQRYLTKIVHRLRKAFRAAGENSFLVQTHRRLGVRFALRV